MESYSINNYKDILARCSSVKSNEDTIIKISKMVWEICKNVPEDNCEYRSSMFCLAVNIAVRCTEEEQEDMIKKICTGACHIAMTLTQHPFDIVKEDFEDDNNSIETVLLLMEGRVYIPNVCTFYNVIETTYRTIDSEYYNLALCSICCLTSCLVGVNMDQCLAANSIIALIRMIVSPSPDAFNITSKTKVECAHVDIVYNCIVSSPLFDIIFSTNNKQTLLKYTPNINRVMKDIQTLPKKKKTNRKVYDNIILPACTIKHLGTGQYGIVTSIKTLDGDKLARKEQTKLDPFLREATIIASLYHKNVLSLHKFDIRRLSMDTPIYPHTLESLIEARVLTKSLARSFTKQLFAGLAYIHSCGIMHGDIKPNNILITSKYTLKIADFGMAIAGCTRERRTMTNHYVSWPYRPYELYDIIEKNSNNISCSIGSNSGEEYIEHCVDYSYEIDIWSCGVVILQMYNKGWFAACEMEMKENIKIVLEDYGVNLTADMEEDIGMIVRQCFSHPTIRPNALQCLMLLN